MGDVLVAGELRKRRDVDAGAPPVRERGVACPVDLEVDRGASSLATCWSSLVIAASGADVSASNWTRTRSTACCAQERAPPTRLP
jgi:hypothetical protein